ncbi:hypothetical protein OROMI_025440 [Orobanche minor]
MRKRARTSGTSSSKSASSNAMPLTVLIDGQEHNFENEYRKFMDDTHCHGDAFEEQNDSRDDANPSGTQPEGSQPSQTQQKPASRSRTLKSPAWLLFEKDKEKQIASCRLCDYSVSHKNGSGTGTLSRHFAKHPDFDPTGGDVRTQQHLQVTTGGQVENWRYSHKRAREATVRYVVQKEKPFSFAEDPVYEAYVQTALQPQWKRIPRSTLYNDGMRLFKEDCDTLKAVFDSLSCKFSFTSDLWTGRCNLSYMCVTAHWVDDDWIMQKRIIDFVELPHPHTGQEIHSQMLKTLRHWSLKDRSLSFSFDNASNNLSAVRFLSQALNPILGAELFHVGCICHIIHYLCVKDGLNHILGSIEKIRSCLSHITSSSTRTQKYRELVILSGKKYCYPYLDCRIRWNSTFRMLQECRNYANEIIEICSDFQVEDDEVDPTNNYLKMNDFDVVDVLRPLLQKFKEFSDVMWGQLYPTSNLLLAYMVHISKIFSNLKKHALLGKVIEGMLTKWLKYFSKVPAIAILTACLDPRCKIDGCVSLLKMYLRNIGLEYTFDEDKEKAKINVMFTTLYDAYNADARPIGDVLESQASNDEDDGIFGSLLGGTSMSTTTSKTNATVNEVMYFFGGSKTPDKPGFNVLHWWRDEARSSFPILRRIARDLLASQISTVASESCFSATGRTLTDKRSRLTPKSIRFCVMWKDMLDAETRTKLKLEEDDDEFDIFMRGCFDNLDDDFVPDENN